MNCDLYILPAWMFDTWEGTRDFLAQPGVPVAVDVAAMDSGQVTSHLPDSCRISASTEALIRDVGVLAHLVARGPESWTPPEQVEDFFTMAGCSATLWALLCQAYEYESQDKEALGEVVIAVHDVLRRQEDFDRTIVVEAASA